MITQVATRMTKLGRPQYIHSPHRPCGRSSFNAHTTSVPSQITCPVCLVEAVADAFVWFQRAIAEYEARGRCA